ADQDEQRADRGGAAAAGTAEHGPDQVQHEERGAGDQVVDDVAAGARAPLGELAGRAVVVVVVHLLVAGLGRRGGGRRTVAGLRRGLAVPGLGGRLAVPRLGGRLLTVPGLRRGLAVAGLAGLLAVPRLGRRLLTVPGLLLPVARLLTVRVVGVTHTCSLLIDPVVL